MTRGIKEGDHAVVSVHVISTDVLGNATGLASGHTAFADVIEQRGFAVVNVTHDGHHRCARHGLTRLQLFIDRCQDFLFGILGFGNDSLVAHFLDHQHRGFLIQRLVDGNHHAHAHQHLDDLGSLDRHARGQIGHGDGVRHFNSQLFRLDRLLEAVLRIGTGVTATTALAALATLVVRNMQLAATMPTGIATLARCVFAGLFSRRSTHALGLLALVV